MVAAELFKLAKQILKPLYFVSMMDINVTGQLNSTFNIENIIFLRYTNPTSVALLDFVSSYDHSWAGSQLGRFKKMPFIVGGGDSHNVAETIEW